MQPRDRLVIKGSRTNTILTLGWTAFVLVGTLRPASYELTTTGLCLICGERGLADALLNLALFIPLGIGGRRMGLSTPLLLLLGVGFSGAIETAQFFIPGRDASVGDILMNGSGAFAGALLSPRLATLLRPDARVGEGLTIGWGTVIAAHFWILALLLEPRLPGEDGQLDLAPPAPDGEYYAGTVLAQRLDGAPLAPDAVISWQSGPKQSEGRVDLDVESASFRSDYRPFVGLTVPGDTTALLNMGPTDFDLIVRLRRPIDRLRLSPTDLRQDEAFEGFEEGDLFTASVWRGGESFCLAVNDEAQCGFGFTTGSGWALLSPVGWGNGALDRGLDALWLGCLLFPLGYWGRRQRAFWGMAGLVIISAAAAPAVTQLLSSTLPTLGGIIAGLVLGQTGSRLPARLSRSSARYQQIP